MQIRRETSICVKNLAYCLLECDAVSFPDNEWSKFLPFVGKCQSNYKVSLPVKVIILIITAMRHYPMLYLDGLGKNTENPQDSLSVN